MGSHEIVVTDWQLVTLDNHSSQLLAIFTRELDARDHDVLGDLGGTLEHSPIGKACQLTTSPELEKMLPGY